MKSDICKLAGQEGQMEAIFRETEKCAVYKELDALSTLRLRLLAEELVEMLPALLQHAEGTFWIESEQKKFELHVSVQAYQVDLELRDKLISVSKSGKNAAAVGIMGKIRAAAETMLLAADESAEIMDFCNYGLDSMSAYRRAWSMQNYVRSIKAQSKGAETEAAWDELEKSIIANLADDVIVGVKGNQVDVIVRKEFQ